MLTQLNSVKLPCKCGIKTKEKKDRVHCEDCRTEMFLWLCSWSHFRFFYCCFCFFLLNLGCKEKNDLNQKIGPTGDGIELQQSTSQNPIQIKKEMVKKWLLVLEKKKLFWSQDFPVVGKLKLTELNHNASFLKWIILN